MLLGLALQSLLPFLQRSGPALGALGAAFEQHCLPDKPGDHGPPAKAPHKTAPCPICVAVHLVGTAIAPMQAPLPAPASQSIAMAESDVTETARLSQLTAHRPRGPPAIG